MGFLTTGRRAWVLLAILWLALRIPQLMITHAVEVDSANFAFGVADFDMLRHQPHPAGFPLWVMAARGLTSAGLNPMTAMNILALLFAVGSLFFVYRLSLRWLTEEKALAVTALLAFSPMFSQNATLPLAYAVDLFHSALLGWLAYSLFHGPSRPVVAACLVWAVCAGFRQPGAMLLTPLLGVALLANVRRRPVQVLAGLCAGAAVVAAWLVPLVLDTGGWEAWSRASNENNMNAFRATSAIFGAGLKKQIFMAIDNGLYLSAALCGLLPLAWVWLKRRACPAGRDLAFFALWILPSLLATSLLHGSKPNYQCLILPPLFLLVAVAAEKAAPDLRWGRPLAAGIVMALAVAYFPYRWFESASKPSALFGIYRATPIFSLRVETSNRELEKVLHGLPAETVFVNTVNRADAPNQRTCSYDFPEREWRNMFSSCDAGRPCAVVATGAGLPDSFRAAEPQLNRIAGNEIYSLWFRD